MAICPPLSDTMKIGQACDLPEGSLAGEEGFEPSNAGIKIRCLDQLGDSPAGCSNGFASERGANNTGDSVGKSSPFIEFLRVDVGAGRRRSSPSCRRELLEHGLGLAASGEAGKDAGAGAGHHGLRRCCFSQARCSATAGKLAQATGSRSLWPWPWCQSAGIYAGVSRLSSGAPKMAAVGTWTAGCRTR
jgi:hypothetical protein